MQTCPLNVGVRAKSNCVAKALTSSFPCVCSCTASTLNKGIPPKSLRKGTPAKKTEKYIVTLSLWDLPEGQRSIRLLTMALHDGFAELDRLNKELKGYIRWYNLILDCHPPIAAKTAPLPIPADLPP